MIRNYMEIIKHVNNCCITHGCKYDNKDCPVVLAKYDQKNLCDKCKELIPNIVRTIELLNEYK